MVRVYAFFAAVLCLGSGLNAQTTKHATQSLEWTSLNITIGLSKKVGIVNDANFRFIGKFQDQQNQLRTGLEYAISPKLSIVPIGYSYIWNFRYGQLPSTYKNNEFRLWQQIQYKHKIGMLAVGHRLRTEERNIEHRHGGVESGEVVYDGYSNDQFRVRYRLSGILPMKKSPEATHYYFAHVWDELFYSKGHYVKYTGPSQNRLFAGVGYQFNKSTSFQTGFLYQTWKNDAGTQIENNVGILAQFTYAFSLLKKTRS